MLLGAESLAFFVVNEKKSFEVHKREGPVLDSAGAGNSADKTQVPS